MAKEKLNTEYTEAEAQARFEKTLRAALNTPPKPLKDMKKGRKNEASDPTPKGNQARVRDVAK